MSDLLNCKDCIHDCYTEGFCEAQEMCNFFVDKRNYVKVVHCKDCVHMKVKFNARFCEIWCMFNGMGDEGFCNYGERGAE